MHPAAQRSGPRARRRVKHSPAVMAMICMRTGADRRQTQIRMQTISTPTPKVHC